MFPRTLQWWRQLPQGPAAARQRGAQSAQPAPSPSCPPAARAEGPGAGRPQDTMSRSCDIKLLPKLPRRGTGPVSPRGGSRHGSPPPASGRAGRPALAPPRASCSAQAPCGQGAPRRRWAGPGRAAARLPRRRRRVWLRRRRAGSRRLLLRWAPRLPGWATAPLSVGRCGLGTFPAGGSSAGGEASSREAPGLPPPAVTSARGASCRAPPASPPSSGASLLLPRELRGGWLGGTRRLSPRAAARRRGAGEGHDPPPPCPCPTAGGASGGKEEGGRGFTVAAGVGSAARQAGGRLRQR